MKCLFVSLSYFFLFLLYCAFLVLRNVLVPARYLCLPSGGATCFHKGDQIPPIWFWIFHVHYWEFYYDSYQQILGANMRTDKCQNENNEWTLWSSIAHDFDYDYLEDIIVVGNRRRWCCFSTVISHNSEYRFLVFVEMFTLFLFLHIHLITSLYSPRYTIDFLGIHHVIPLIS